MKSQLQSILTTIPNRTSFRKYKDVQKFEEIEITMGLIFVSYQGQTAHLMSKQLIY